MDNHFSNEHCLLETTSVEQGELNLVNGTTDSKQNTAESTSSADGVESPRDAGETPLIVQQLHDLIGSSIIPAINGLKQEIAEHQDLIMSTLVNAVALIIDRVFIELKTATELHSDPDFIAACRRADLEEFRSLLAMFDVEAFSPSPGAKFDPSMCRIASIRKCADPARNAHVIRTLRLGYRRSTDGHLFRPASVEVQKYGC